VQGSGVGSIGDLPRSGKRPDRIESGGTHGGPECYPSRQESHESMPLAHCEAVTLVTPPNVEQPQIQRTTPKFQDMIAAAKPDVSDAESRELEELLTEYRYIFAVKSNDYGRTNRVYYHIDTGVARSVYQPARGIPQQNRRILARCSRTCNNMELSNIQTARGLPPSFSSNRRMGTCASAWTETELCSFSKSNYRS
jgi:hypothetical protein